jgi:hypothetical protein
MFVLSRSMLQLGVDADAAFTGIRPYLQIDGHFHVARRCCGNARSEVSLSVYLFSILTHPCPLDIAVDGESPI